MKDSYSFDIDEAGLDKSYDAAPRRLHQDLRPARLPLRHRPGDGRRHGRVKSEEFLATAENGEDTYVRCDNCGYAANVEAVRVPAPVPVAASRAAGCRPPTSRTPPTRRPSTPWSTSSTRAHPARRTVRGRPDTLKNVVVMLVHPDGRREPLVVGVPGDREVDEKRLAAQVEPAVVEAVRGEVTSRHTRRWCGATSAPEALGDPERASATGIRYLVDPRVVEGTAWVTGRQPQRQARPGRPGRRARLHARRDDRGRRGQGRRPLPVVRPGRGLRGRARHRDGPHLPARHASTPRRWTSRCSTRTASCVTVVMGSYGVGVSRAVACVAEGNHDEFGLSGRGRSRPPTSTSSRPARTSGLRRGRDARSRAGGRRRDGVFDDRVGVSPG
jgi:prolyl-tRNA synthetase